MQHSGFNPKARWDRNVPLRDDDHPDNINERIEVLAWFRNGRPQPKAFLWKNKLYRVKHTNYNWQERSGSANVSYFSVDTDSGLYQISLNHITLSWQLDKPID